VISNVKGALPQALESSLNCKGKGVMKKNSKKKKAFQLTKHIFFFFFLVTPLIFKLHNFLIFESFSTI